MNVDYITDYSRVHGQNLSRASRVLLEIGTGWAFFPPINALEQFDWQVLREGGLCIVYSRGLEIRQDLLELYCFPYCTLFLTSL